MTEARRVGIVGARGYVGAELLRLISTHSAMRLELTGSRELAGEQVPGFPGAMFEVSDPTETARRNLNGVFLALPDGSSHDYVDAIDSVDPRTVIVDLSFDHRLDDTWVYGLPELRRREIRGATRIANPGCYATAMQIGLAPLLDHIDGPAVVFGVSGHSGAGTTPSPKNDPELLADNLIPYRLVGHNHERETTRQLGRPIRFIPHVHPAFSGLLTTIHIPLSAPMTTAELMDIITDFYPDEPLVEVQEAVPDLRDGAGRAGVVVGGVAITDDGLSAVVVVAEDNLLKGAAVQAMQNMNLALGLPEFSGIR